MLEVLKQLQVKPLARCGQANICNQKMPGDWGFLAALHLGNLSYRQTGRGTAFSFFRRDFMLQQFLQTRCKALSYLDLLEKRTANFQNLQKQTALEQSLKKPPKRQKQTVFDLKLTI